MFADGKREIFERQLLIASDYAFTAIKALKADI